MRAMHGVMCGWLAASCCLVSLTAGAQRASSLKQCRLARWDVPAAEYSGIASLGDGRYALISDKQNGFYPLSLQFSSRNGRLLRAERGALKETGKTGTLPEVPLRDCEGVAYCPSSQSLYISGEADQRILEYDTLGRLTGRELQVPHRMGREAIYGNYGFEALAYDHSRRCFWTTTESCLRADGKPAGPSHRVRNLLRLQTFGEDGRPGTQYAYEMDLPVARKAGRHYVYGVSALTVLPDGRLVVLEREVYIARRYVGSWAQVNLFVVDPSQGHPLSPDGKAEEARSLALSKRCLLSFRTRITPVSCRLANYEGLCVGPRLDDGRLTLLLVSDSQGGAGKGRVRLQDYLKVVVLPSDGTF